MVNIQNMNIIYIYNVTNIDLFILNVNIFLNKLKLLNNNLYDIIIVSNHIPTINHNIKIISENLIFKNIENSNYENIIEIDYSIDLNTFLSYEFNKDNYITCNYTNYNNCFSDDDLKILPKITKRIDINTIINNIPDSIKIYNLNNLKKINWINTMDYLQKKCKELNVDVNNQKLLILFQLLYPQYITLQEFDKYIEKEVKIKETTIEDKEYEKIKETIIEDNKQDEKIKENIIEEEIIEDNTIKNIWLIKRSSCKVLLNNYVLSIEDTILKKNCVRENKTDPTDKINIRIGKKLKLCLSQNLNHFYIVEY